MAFTDTLTWHPHVTTELIDQVFTIDDGVVVTDAFEQYAAASAAAFHTHRAESGDDDHDPFLLTTRADLAKALTMMATIWRL